MKIAEGFKIYFHWNLNKTKRLNVFHVWVLLGFFVIVLWKNTLWFK